MSLETLLLVFVILAPLIELFRATRRRGLRTQKRLQEPAETARQSLIDAQPSAKKPVRAVPTVPVKSATAGQTLPDTIAVRQHTPKQHGAESLEGDRAGRWQARRRKTVVGFRDSLDLRRTIVSMTILGPCRANSPHDCSQGTRHQ
jgi:hypothetical protein